MTKISLSLLSFLLFASFGILAINADSNSESDSDSESGSSENNQNWNIPKGYHKNNYPVYPYPIYSQGGYQHQPQGLAPYNGYPFYFQPPPPYPYPYGGYYPNGLGQTPHEGNGFPAPVPQGPYQQSGGPPAYVPEQGAPGLPGATSTINHSLKVNKEYQEDGHHTNAP